MSGCDAGSGLDSREGVRAGAAFESVVVTGDGVVGEFAGYHYTLESGPRPDSFPTIEATPGIATGHEDTITVPITGSDRYFRFKITGP